MSNQQTRESKFVLATGALAKAPISAAVRVGEFILVSGQIAIEDNGTIVAGGIAEETRACILSLQAILKSAGSSLRDVVQTRVYLTNFAEYEAYNAVYREYFSDPYPTRSTIGAPELALGASIEIEAVAVSSTTSH